MIIKKEPLFATAALFLYDFNMIITAGIYRGRKIKTPDENIVRPTLSKIREGVFNILFSMIDFKDKYFLDMFAGSGIMGLEAISRGFYYVMELEKKPKVAKIIKENYEKLGVKLNLKIGDSLKQKLLEKFDVIYIDPPYYSDIYEKALMKIEKEALLKDNGIIVLEHVKEICLEGLNFKQIKQKKYSDKIITVLSRY